MKIAYKNNYIQKVCTDYSIATKEFGAEMAEKIQLRITQITASLSLEQLLQYRIGRCHALKGKRNGQFAMDLVHPYRLVFEQNGQSFEIITILEVVDHH